MWLHLFLKVIYTSFFKKPKPDTNLQKALLFSVSLCSFSQLVMRLHKLNWVCLLLNAVISALSKVIQTVHTSVAEARQGGKRRLPGKKLWFNMSFLFEKLIWGSE